MTVIAVTGVPNDWMLLTVLKAIVRSVKGHFEVLNFDPAKKSPKVCYVKLSDELDPMEVVQRIKDNSKGPGALLKAYVPNKVPHLNKTATPVVWPRRLEQLPVSRENQPIDVLLISFREIVDELSLTYFNLLKISLEHDHKLLNKVSQCICDRFILMVQTNKKVLKCSYDATKMYRKNYPVNTDWALITQCCAELDKELGLEKPTKLDEEEIKKVKNPKDAEVEILQRIYNKYKDYSEPIMHEIQSHIDSLDCEPSENDTEEEKMQKKIRLELKKVNAYTDLIIRQLVTRNIQYKKRPLRCRLYAYPYMPPMHEVTKMLEPYYATRVYRSDRMYNCATFTMHAMYLETLTAEAAKGFGVIRFVVRPFSKNRFKAPEHVVKQLKALIPK